MDSFNDRLKVVRVRSKLSFTKRRNFRENKALQCTGQWDQVRQLTCELNEQRCDLIKPTPFFFFSFFLYSQSKKLAILLLALKIKLGTYSSLWSLVVSSLLDLYTCQDHFRLVICTFASSWNLWLHSYSSYLVMGSAQQTLLQSI